MSVKQPPSPVLRADVRKDQPRNQPYNRQKNFWKKAATMLLTCLALFFLLTSPASTPLIRHIAVISPTPLNPVGSTTIVTDPGFDTCVTPPASLLQTWWTTSPYKWLNVYLGGVSMFPQCGGKNLTPDWVNTVYNQGWSLLPTWVGPQAPCATQHTVMSSDATISYMQGRDEADTAINAASRLGFSSTAPIYFDMEHFNPTRPDGSRNTTCIQAVNAFLSGWNSELTMRNHLAGFYASASNYPVLDNSIATAPFVAWIAGGSSWAEKYNDKCTVSGNVYIPDNDWSTHQRIYQYTGGHNETYGKKTWNIDSDCADAPMVGHITTTAITVERQTNSTNLTFPSQK